MRAKTRRILFSLLLVLILAVIAAVMMVIGRGHTVYFDNKTLEDYQGQEYKAFEKVVVTVKGEQVAKLNKRDRGMAIWIGQNFKMTLEITEKKGDEPRVQEVSIKLPYSVDGIVVNLPAYLAGLPEEEVPGEGGEFGLEGDLGLEDGLGDI